MVKITFARHEVVSFLPITENTVIIKRVSQTMAHFSLKSHSWAAQWAHVQMLSVADWPYYCD